MRSEPDRCPVARPGSMRLAADPGAVPSRRVARAAGSLSPSWSGRCTCGSTRIRNASRRRRPELGAEGVQRRAVAHVPGVGGGRARRARCGPGRGRWRRVEALVLRAFAGRGRWRCGLVRIPMIALDDHSVGVQGRARGARPHLDRPGRLVWRSTDAVVAVPRADRLAPRRSAELSSRRHGTARHRHREAVGHARRGPLRDQPQPHRHGARALRVADDDRRRRARPTSWPAACSTTAASDRSRELQHDHRRPRAGRRPRGHEGAHRGALHLLPRGVEVVVPEGAGTDCGYGRCAAAY